MTGRTSSTNQPDTLALPVVFEATDPLPISAGPVLAAQAPPSWISGTAGFVRRHGRVTMFGPNGDRVARHRVGRRRTNWKPETPSRISGLQEPTRRATGGPIFDDRVGGGLLMVYRGEQPLAQDPHRAHAILGTAYSDDGGDTFRDLGRIITPEVCPDSSLGSIELGSGAFVQRDDYFYVYFTDQREFGAVGNNLCVARAPVEEVLIAARRGDAVRWRKFHDGQFASAGLGGPCSDLLPGEPRVCWLDATFHEPTRLYLAVCSVITEWRHDGDHRWNHLIIGSRDGLRWSPPQPLFGEERHQSQLFVTIRADRSWSRAVTSDEFDVITTVGGGPSPFELTDATVQTYTVRWRPLDDRSGEATRSAQESGR